MSLFAPLESLIAPPPPAPRVSFLSAQPFAHRGLHGNGIVENSMAAFKAAISAGHGIELDVQCSSDGQAFVFHDARFERLTNATGAIAETRAADVAEIRLRGTSETISLLTDVLNMIGGRVPVLIEVKSDHPQENPKCLAVRRALEGYPSKVAVMSFNPDIPRWFHKHATRVVRGLVVTEEGRAGFKGGMEREMALALAKPDFLAYDVRDLATSTFAARQRKRGLPVLTWTVRSPADERTAATFADEIIYEATSPS